MSVDHLLRRVTNYDDWSRVGGSLAHSSRQGAFLANHFIPIILVLSSPVSRVEWKFAMACHSKLAGSASASLPMLPSHSGPRTSRLMTIAKQPRGQGGLCGALTPDTTLPPQPQGALNQIKADQSINKPKPWLEDSGNHHPRISLFSLAGGGQRLRGYEQRPRPRPRRRGATATQYYYKAMSGSGRRRRRRRRRMNMVGV